MKAPNEVVTYAEKLMKMKAYQRRKLWDIADVINQAWLHHDELQAAETWLELSEEEQGLLWVAETKGGFFSMAEKDWLRHSLSSTHEVNDGEAERT